jgi:hypothetical protein
MARALHDDSEADRVQVELLRSAGPVARFARARSLSASMITLARIGLRRRHPECSEREILLRFVETHYGAELANAVRSDLDRRGR